MKSTYDPEADAAYIRLIDAAVVESEEVRPGCVIDFDSQNRLVGIEIIGLRRQYASAAEGVLAGMAPAGATE